MKNLFNTSFIVLGFYLGIKVIEVIEDTLYDLGKDRNND